MKVECEPNGVLTCTLVAWLAWALSISLRIASSSRWMCLPTATISFASRAWSLAFDVCFPLGSQFAGIPSSNCVSVTGNRLGKQRKASKLWLKASNKAAKIQTKTMQASDSEGACCKGTLSSIFQWLKGSQRCLQAAEQARWTRQTRTWTP